MTITIRTRFNNTTTIVSRCKCGRQITVSVFCGVKPETHSSRFTPPTEEQVDAYAKKINCNVEGKAFCDYYKSNGWVIGKGCKPMKDWKATVRYWKRTSNRYEKDVHPSVKFDKETKDCAWYLIDAYCIITKKKSSSVNHQMILWTTKNVLAVYRQLKKSIRRKLDLQGGPKSLVKLYSKHITNHLVGYHSLQEGSLDTNSKIWHGFIVWLSSSYFGQNKIFKDNLRVNQHVK